MSPSAPVARPLVAASLLAACSGGGNEASYTVKAPDHSPVNVEQVPLQETKATASGCPGGTQWNGSQCAATEVRCSPSVAAPTTIGDSNWRWLRDPRPYSHTHGPLLDTEIQQLENVLRAMDLGSKDRPMLLRRLAEDYVEVEHIAQREKTEAEIKRDAFKQCDPEEAGRQQAIANSRQLKVARSQEAAIAGYRSLVSDYSGAAFLDQVYYYLAYEYEQAGDLATARRVYLDLLAKTPESPFVSLAYLAFGEWFSAEAINDPTQWESAKQAYMKVIATPPPHRTAYGYSWLRLGQIAEHLHEYAQAGAAYNKVTEFARNFPEVPGTRVLAAQVPDWARPHAALDAGSR